MAWFGGPLDAWPRDQHGCRNPWQPARCKLEHSTRVMQSSEVSDSMPLHPCCCHAACACRLATARPMHRVLAKALAECNPRPLSGLANSTQGCRKGTEPRQQVPEPIMLKHSAYSRFAPGTVAKGNQGFLVSCVSISLRTIRLCWCWEPKAFAAFTTRSRYWQISEGTCWNSQFRKQSSFLAISQLNFMR